MYLRMTNAWIVVDYWPTEHGPFIGLWNIFT